MKKARKIAAMIAAMALTATMAVPSVMMSASAEDTSSIEITSTSSVSHTYEIYQVMTGEYNSETGEFTKLKWGADVTAYNSNNVSTGDDVSDADITAISGLADAGTLPASLTLKTTGRKYADKSGAGDITFTGLAEGYYIVKDVTDLTDKDDANSAWIVQVAGTASLAVKSAKPTVDKQVQDETADKEEGADAEGYGESADHAINESFQFKLTATIPADSDLTAYETYKLMFTDTMSAGVTFESIESVTVGGTAIATTAYTANKVGSSPAAAPANGDAGISWTLSIDDIIPLIPTGKTLGSDEIVVEVVYKAHLNKNAVVDPESRTGGDKDHTNNNSVYLNYSNNPDATGGGNTQPGGKTETDYVWVFTYEVDNTKYKINDTAGNELEGAEFRLYESDGSTEVKLIYDSTISAYRPVADGEEATVMTSSNVAGTKGQFNIKGLDTGTYVLKETKAPTDYNAVNPITFTITGTHKEQTADPTKVDLSLSGAGDGIENKPVDTKNTTLPSTGGIGTTLFVLGGGVTAACVGIYLVSKKRTKEETAE